jgi:hypothetical protein
VSGPLSRAELEQRRQAATTHGARSPVRIRAAARNHRRRFLHALGIRATDLDPIARELLRLWSQGMAQLSLRESAGAPDDRGYWTAFANTRRCLDRLEKRLAQLGLDRRRERDPLDDLIGRRDG